MKSVIFLLVALLSNHFADGQCSSGLSPSMVELVTNGDFSSGNSGFTSGYSYTPPPNTTEGQYWVATGAQVPSWNGALQSNGDHTSGTGNFLLVNGNPISGVNVWCQTINVNPNTEYIFSTWISTLFPTNPAVLQFSVNGTILGTTIAAPSSTRLWIPFNATFNSGMNTSVNICIVNQNTSIAGNDFGLDDISLRECSCINPTIGGIIAASNDSVCSGNSSDLFVFGSSGSIQWQSSRDGILFDDLTGANDTFYTTASLSQSSYYRVKATGSCGIDSSSAYHITVIPVPVPLISPSDTILCSGDSVQICVEGALSYLWNTGDTAFCIYVKNSGGYWVTATGEGNCTNVSNRANIANYPIPPVSIIVQGDTLASFNAVAYQWYFDGQLIPGANEAVFVVNKSGSYSLEVTDVNGCKAHSTDVPMVVNDLEDVPDVDHIILYPNPFKDIVSVSDKILTHNISADVYDVLGNLLFQCNTNNATHQLIIDMSGYTAGIYYLEVHSKNRNYTKRLVKQ